jgi:hypothetical protein
MVLRSRMMRVRRAVIVCLLQPSRWEVAFRSRMMESVRSSIAGTTFSYSMVGDMVMVGVGTMFENGKRRIGVGVGDGEEGGDVLTWYESENCEDDTKIFGSDPSGLKRLFDNLTSTIEV